MRLAVLLSLLTGCDLVFELQDKPPPADGPPIVADAAPPPIERNAKLTQRADGSAIKITRGTAIADDEMIVFTVHGVTQTAEILTGPPGFTPLVDAQDSCGAASWHVWVYAGRAGEAADYEFTFDAQLSLSAMGVTYKNVGKATDIRFVCSMQDANLASAELLAGVAGVASGTFAFVALTGNKPIEMDASGLDRIGQFDNMVVYDGVSVNNMIPPITVSIPPSHCIGITEVKLEP